MEDNVWEEKESSFALAPFFRYKLKPYFSYTIKGKSILIEGVIMIYYSGSIDNNEGVIFSLYLK
jgi:hypothetical protein